MRKQIQLVPLAAAALLLGTGTMAATAGPAAASQRSAPARACTVDAPRFTSSPGTGPSDSAFWPARGTHATATTRCNGINLKLDHTRAVRTCFRATGSCNAWRTKAQRSWRTAATDARDGAQFYS
ncbi:hypothetical protein [Streptomyces sp. TLI_146]|uniref:hypothetical protein n=1 Tax=Streptomyces sp. TLI_146 TaxID=1938858 RepID=UPI000C6FD5A4|nr:hypothetical protein [Streptomyces sp. TLI_146]PKV90160.1 hypothetical protein BX283_7842 [Streptomyces sp. TLI_146]